MPLRSPFPDLPFAEAPLHEYVLAEVDKQEAGRVALTDSASGASITFGQVRRLTYKMAHGLGLHGVRKGDVVTVCLPNCVHYPLVLMACYCNGAAVSTVNANFTADELLDHFENAGSRFVFGNSVNVGAICQAARKLGDQVKKIFLLGDLNTGPPSGSPEVIGLDSLWDQEPVPVGAAVRPKTDIAWMPSSSGTTGKPKCLMLSHYNVVGMVRVFGSSHFPQLRAGDHVIGQLPMYHMFGFTVMWMALVKGATIVVLSKFEPRKFLQLVQTYRVPILYIVPPILVFLAKHPLVDEFDLSCVHTLVVRSAPISKELSEETIKRHRNLKYLLQALMRALDDIPFSQCVQQDDHLAFGMSEIGAAMMVPPCPPDQVRHGSCGLLMPNFQAKIVDLKTGEELGPNQSGELYLKSETRMLGYWKNEQATTEAIDPAEGWLRTGDVAYYDADGYFYIVDRLKEMIKVNAYQVAPAELEGVLLTHPDVHDAAVYGVPHQQLGEAPRAMVVKKEGALATEQQLIHYVDGKVAPYKRLRGGVEFVDQIPKSPSGKILRRVLRDRFKDNPADKAKL